MNDLPHFLHYGVATMCAKVINKPHFDTWFKTKSNLFHAKKIFY